VLRKAADMTNLLKIPTWADARFIHAIIETPAAAPASSTLIRSYACSRLQSH
jgi:hypothetical protein